MSPPTPRPGSPTPAPKDPYSHPPRTPLVLNVGVTGHKPGGTRRMPDKTAIRQTARELLDRIRQTVEAIATAHPELFAARLDGSGGGKSTAPVRLVSQLAEGADLWVALEALESGYELQTVLPRRKGEYLTEFSGGEFADVTFLTLLEMSDAVFQLDGGPSRELAGGGDETGLITPSKSPSHVVASASPPNPYVAAGRVMLNQCDLLIAVWDGEEERGPGGTAYIVRQAWERGTPVIVIRWADPRTWHFSEPQWRVAASEWEFESDWPRLKGRIEEILLPPGYGKPEAASTEREDLREAYFNEIEPAQRSSLLRWFSNHAEWFARRVEFGDPAWRLPAPEPSGNPGSTIGPGAFASAKLDPDLERKREEGFLDHYRWANVLSIHYGRLYRSTVVTGFLLAGLAVAFALLGVLFEPLWEGLHHPTSRVPSSSVVAPDTQDGAVEVTAPARSKEEDRNHLGKPEFLGVLLEFLTIGCIVMIWWRGRSGRWHERWIDYRTLAERLRVARLLWLIGGSRQPPTIPVHLANYGHPAATWMHWHFLSVQRAAGLPRVCVDGPYLEAVRDVLQTTLLNDQEQYHRRAARRLGHLDHRLHNAAISLFVITGALCLTHLVVAILAPGLLRPWVSNVLTAASAVLPAFGAALAAIRSHGEFHRLAQRSAAMAAGLGHLERNLCQIQPSADPALGFAQIQSIAEETAQLMNNETLDWRIVFQDRPITLPA